MRIQKKVIAHLEKCYALARLDYKNQPCFLVAAEKHAPCYLFREDGTQIDTVWEEPGGVMTMLQVPGSDGRFLATHKFYSPNDSKEAKIVIAEPGQGGGWTVRTLVEIPFVHRFGILRRGGVSYLIVCCLKTGHQHKDDWSSPGRVLAAELPEDLSGFHDGCQLALTELKTGMLKNHGYCFCRDRGIETAVVTCEQGVFQFFPPGQRGGGWEIRRLLDEPVSDAIVWDLDGDGKPELGCFSPFHGNRLAVYHQDGEGTYRKAWEYPRPCEMLHAIWAGDLCGKPAWVVGYRNGERRTMIITWADGGYRTHILDENAGAANVMHFINGAGKDVLVAANRETDEIAMYTFLDA